MVRKYMRDFVQQHESMQNLTCWRRGRSVEKYNSVKKHKATQALAIHAKSLCLGENSKMYNDMEQWK